jgi:hypothetical protein
VPYGLRMVVGGFEGFYPRLVHEVATYQVYRAVQHVDCQAVGALSIVPLSSAKKA